MDDGRARRLALNEAIAREVNAAVEHVAGGWHADEEQIELICECSRDACTDRIRVTLEDYRAVRDHPLRFLVLDPHVVEEIERRVGTAGNATVVEKTGPGRAVAAETAEER